MTIRVDDLRGPEIAQLLQEHLSEMKPLSPPESQHALDMDGLRKPEITFWTIWDGEQLAGCVALKELDAYHGELTQRGSFAAVALPQSSSCRFSTKPSGAAITG